MLSVHEARQRILSQFSPLESESVPLEQAAGRVLAEEVAAHFDLPPFDNSSVDGFAIRAAELAGAERNHPVRLPVIGDIPAGMQPTFTLEGGQAARIMTGAPLPPGADAVVMVEDTDCHEHGARLAGAAVPENVSIYRGLRVGENVRRRGSDLKTGQVVLLPGRLLRAQEIGMLAMLGLASVRVHRKPKVAILSTGDEIVPLGAPLAPGKIHDSNSYALAVLAARAGCEALRLGVAADTREAVREKFEAAIQAGVDVILSSAGVSVGAFDYVREVVEEGGTLDFWKVNMRPGKPLAFGHYRGVPFFGLPGNPVSVFVAPTLERLQGLPDAAPDEHRDTAETEPDSAGADARATANPASWAGRLRVCAILGEGLESDGRESYLRASVRLEDGQYVARFSTNQSSGNLFSLVESNALLIIPSGVKSCPPGTEVEVWFLP